MFLCRHRALLWRADTALEWYLDKEKAELTLAVPTGEQPPPALIAPVVKQLFSLEGSQVQTPHDEHFHTCRIGDVRLLIESLLSESVRVEHFHSTLSLNSRIGDAHLTDCCRQAAPVSRVRLSALTFKHAAPTYMEDYAVGSGGDYSLYQGGVVHMNGTANCTVDHNLFDAVGGNGVFLTDFNRHALISANEMRRKMVTFFRCVRAVSSANPESLTVADIGENGVAMRGSTDWVDGRGGNQ